MTKNKKDYEQKNNNLKNTKNKEGLIIEKQSFIEHVKLRIE